MATDTNQNNQTQSTGLVASWSPAGKTWQVTAPALLSPEVYEAMNPLYDQPQPAPATPVKPAHKSDLAQRMAKRFASRDSQNIIHEQLTLVADGYTRNWWRTMTKETIGRECAIESLSPSEATKVIAHLKDIRKTVGTPGQRFNVTYGAKMLYRQVEPTDKTRREKEYAEYLRRESLTRSNGRTDSVHCLTTGELVVWSLALQKATAPTAPVAPAQIPAIVAIVRSLGDGTEHHL